MVALCILRMAPFTNQRNWLVGLLPNRPTAGVFNARTHLVRGVTKQRESPAKVQFVGGMLNGRIKWLSPRMATRETNFWQIQTSCHPIRSAMYSQTEELAWVTRSFPSVRNLRRPSAARSDWGRIIDLRQSVVNVYCLAAGFGKGDQPQCIQIFTGTLWSVRFSSLTGNENWLCVVGYVAYTFDQCRTLAKDDNMHYAMAIAIRRRTSQLILSKNRSTGVTSQKGKNLRWMIFLSKRAPLYPENLGFCPPLWNGMTSRFGRGWVTSLSWARLLTVIFVGFLMGLLFDAEC